MKKEIHFPLVAFSRSGSPGKSSRPFGKGLEVVRCQDWRRMPNWHELTRVLLLVRMPGPKFGTTIFPANMANTRIFVKRSKEGSKTRVYEKMRLLRTGRNATQETQLKLLRKKKCLRKSSDAFF